MPTPTPDVSQTDAPVDVLSTGELVGNLRKLACDVGARTGDADTAERLHRLADRVDLQGVVTPAAGPVISVPFGTSDGVRVDVRIPHGLDPARVARIKAAAAAYVAEQAKAEAPPGPGGAGP